MNFLIILAAVLMVHQGEVMHYFQRDEWFADILRRLSVSARQPHWLPFALAVVAPVVLLSLLLVLVGDYWWIVFTINAGVLLFAIGRGSWRDECDSWVVFFAERDPLIIKQKLADEKTQAGEVSDTDIENTWLDARSEVLYHQLDGFYTTVFWFFVLGAPAALFYRLLRLYQQNEKVTRGELPEMGLLQWLVEWLPVRVMAMLFCLVGNFTTGFWVLKQVIVDGVLNSTAVLTRCADAALFLDGSVDDDAVLPDELDEKKSRTAKMIQRMEARALEQKTLNTMRRYSVELQALLQRSEWAFLVFIAMMTLV